MSARRLVFALITGLLMLAPMAGHVHPLSAQNADQMVFVVARTTTSDTLDLYRVSADGSDETLLDTGGLDYGSVHLSDDRSRFFYFKQVDAENRQLWTTTYDGTIARGLGDPFSDTLSASYEISPTAQHVLLSLLDPVEETQARSLINVQSGGSSSATSSGIVHFSSDGQSIHYGYTSGGDALRWIAARRSVTPGAVEEVVVSDMINAQSAFVDVIPVPDSDTYIVFITIGVPDQGGTLGERFVYLVAADGTLTQLKHSSTGFDFFEYATTREVNGEQFVIFREAPGSDLTAVNLTTGSHRSLADGDAVFLDASADLSQIIYRDHVPQDTEGVNRLQGVYFKTAASAATEIVRDYVVDGHIINDRYAGFYNTDDDASAGWDIYRVWDTQAREPALLFDDVDSTTRLFANAVNDLLVLRYRKRDDQSLKLVIYDSSSLTEIMTFEVLNPGDVTISPERGVVTFVSHEEPDRVYLLDLTRDVLVPYVLTEASRVWSFALDG